MSFSARIARAPASVNVLPRESAKSETIFWVCIEILPSPSTKCHVTVELPWVLRVRESVVVPVIVPEQLSVAVGGAVMVAEHCPVTSGNDATLGTGATVS